MPRIAKSTRQADKRHTTSSQNPPMPAPNSPSIYNEAAGRVYRLNRGNQIQTTTTTRQAGAVPKRDNGSKYQTLPRMKRTTSESDKVLTSRNLPSSGNI